MAQITIDDKEYDTDTMSDQANATIRSLQFVDMQLLQLRNELAIADTARLAYARAFKRELEKAQDTANDLTISEI